MTRLSMRLNEGELNIYTPIENQIQNYFLRGDAPHRQAFLILYVQTEESFGTPF